MQVSPCNIHSEQLNSHHYDYDFWKTFYAARLTESQFYFLQWSTLCFDDITGNVKHGKNTCDREPQVHGADTKLVYNTQEVEANDKVADLIK